MKDASTKSPKHAISSASSKEFSENGMTTDSSKQSEHPEECDSSIYRASIPHSSRNPRQKKILSQSSTQESLLKSRKVISKDSKSSSRPIFLTNIPDPRLTKCQTSDQGLTLKDPDCYKFWDASRKEEYQRLSWLPETDLPDLDSNLSNGCAQSSGPKSWFSTLKTQPQNQNSEKTSWQSSKFIVVDGMAVEDIVEKIKVRKLKLRPNKQQKEALNQWAGSVRFLYNKTIALLTNPKNKTIRGKYQLRNRLATVRSQTTKRKNSFYNSRWWLKNCPNSVRQGAVYEAKANLEACYTNKSNGNIKKFQSPYRTKKKEIQHGWSFSIEKQNICKVGNCLQILPKKLKDMRYYGTKQLHKLMPKVHPDMDCKIQKNAFGEYFLILPYTCKQKKQINKGFTNPVAVDPGVRKFLTTYAPNSKESYMMGNRWSSTLVSHLVQVDSLYSQLSKEKDTGKKKTLKAELKRRRKRIFNLKTEMRFKCARFLASNYDLVMMPKLDSGKLCIKANRRLTTKTSRNLLNAGHAKFFDTLKDKCWENGSKFLHVREEYTSQTCPCCGTLNKCDEVYRCRECSFRHDRDIVGAFNILLKGVRTQNPGA